MLLFKFLFALSVIFQPDYNLFEQCCQHLRLYIRHRTLLGVIYTVAFVNICQINEFLFTSILPGLKAGEGTEPSL